MKKTKIIFTSSVLNLLLIIGSIFYFQSHTLPDNQSVQKDVKQNEPTLNLIKENMDKKGNVVQTVEQNKQSQVEISKTNSNKIKDSCLIKIKDKVYNLDKFRSLHSGGDIFQCNTDMTKIFSQNHSDSYLQQLKPYLVR